MDIDIDIYRKPDKIVVSPRDVQDITAEEERHAKQVVAMAAFRATERDAVATQYGKEDAEAAINRMEKRLEKLQTLQVLK